jgi:hypothetical protein
MFLVKKKYSTWSLDMKVLLVPSFPPMQSMQMRAFWSSDLFHWCHLRLQHSFSPMLCLHTTRIWIVCDLGV